MSWGIPTKELMWNTYDYLANWADGPQTLTELQRKANTYIPIADIERAIRLLAKRGWVKGVVREDGEVAYTIKGPVRDDATDWEDLNVEEQESYWTDQEEEGEGPAVEEQKKAAAEGKPASQVAVSQPRPQTLTNGGTLDIDQSILKISFDAPRVLVERFNVSIKGRYDGRDEALRRGMRMVIMEYSLQIAPLNG